MAFSTVSHKWNKENPWYAGTRFNITPKTRYESLPTRGDFKIIHVGSFDGERFWTGDYCSVVQCVKYDSEYTILDNLTAFSKAELDGYLEEGYLHIKKSSEDNS